MNNPTREAKLMCLRKEVFDEDGRSLGYATMDTGPDYTTRCIPNELLHEVDEILCEFHGLTKDDEK